MVARTYKGPLRISRRTRSVGEEQVCVFSIRTRYLSAHEMITVTAEQRKRFAREVPDRVVLDISQIQNADDFGSDYQALALRVYHALRAVNPTMKFAVCVPDFRFEVFHHTGFDRLFPIYDDLKEACRVVSTMSTPRFVSMPSVRKPTQVKTTPCCKHCGKPLSCPACG